MPDNRHYVLDTDCLSYFFNRPHDYPHLVARVSAVSRTNLALTAVTVEERLRGSLDLIHQHRNKPKEPEAYSFFCTVLTTLQEFRILPYTEEAARIFRALTPEVKRLGPLDCRIAAIAIAHNATVVTHNVRDFSRIIGCAV
jgi:tRNA(fMet)-specific endonuclease VapC